MDEVEKKLEFKKLDVLLYTSHFITRDARMSLITLSITEYDSNETPDHANYRAELSFDGRVIGELSNNNDGLPAFSQAQQARDADITGALKWVQGQPDATPLDTLPTYADKLARKEIRRKSAIVAMRKRLKRHTLFATPAPERQILRITQVYSERIRAQIQKTHPGSVILNTLSEEEAFRHFHPNEA